MADLIMFLVQHPISVFFVSAFVFVCFIKVIQYLLEGC